MFELLFGWRKASRCKKLIRRVQCRLKLLKNKRESIIRQFRQDVVQLIKNGHDECALSRVEQLYKDQSIKAVYDLLDNFCEFIVINLSYMRRHKDCPNDINEAMSSLLYASARCGDLPELIKLRKLFGERYGQKFAVTAVELLYGNLVNRQIIENLCVKSMPDDLKLNLMKEIATENGLQLDYPKNDDEFEQHHQRSNPSMENYNVEWIRHNVETDIRFTYYDGIDGSMLQVSTEKELQKLDKSNNSTSEWKKIAERSLSYSSFDTKNDSNDAITAIQSAPDIIQSSSSNLILKSLVNIEILEELDCLYEDEMAPDRSSCQSNPGRCSSSLVSDVPLQHKVEKITEAASESPSRFSERSIVYLDDVEELQPIKKEKDEDQRLFMFKNIPSMRKNHAAITISLSGIPQDHTEPCEPSDGKSSSRNASKRRKSSRRRLKRRYVLVENLSMKDVECEMYYGEPNYSSPDDDLSSLRSYTRKKHQQKMTDADTLSSSSTNYQKKLSSSKSPYFYARRVPNGTLCKEIEKHNMAHKCILDCGDGNFSHDKAADCSLEHPCYSFANDDKDDFKIPYPERKIGTKTLKEFPDSILQQGKCEDLQNCLWFSNDAISTNVVKGFRVAMDKATSKQVQEAEVIDCRCSFASSHDSCSRIISSWTHSQPPYLRVMTMPPDRPKETPSHQFLRSTSCLPKQHNYLNISSHSYVHPKLPDYDDLAAKFKALKKDHMLSSTSEE